MTREVAPCAYRFGRFELQPAERRLLLGGKVTRLNKRAFDLLLTLVERAGQLVTNEELLEHVWLGRPVEPSNINVQITKLRKLLGRNLIENEGQHGYRFTLPVEVITTRDRFLYKPAHERRDAPAFTFPPAQTSPFIGRENEIRAIRTQLADGHVRLLTLSGVAGTGKTRLALQVAAGLVDEVEHGVFFVPLATLSDPALVLPTIAKALDVHDAASTPLLEQLKDYLREKQLLLVLDNFEHVIDAAPAVTELLTAAPRLQVLVTSREVLRVGGERDYPVPPLSLPDRKQLPSLEQLTRYEAVALFVERAAAVKAGFALSGENANAVVEICHRLDGLPLAIELAAARVRVMPPQRMLAELSHRLSFLVGTARDRPARQRTLRGAIDWGHDLLTSDEQKLFRRLAVFAGGCGLEAIEAVCNGETDLPILDTLEFLVDKSLLKQSEALGEPRFAMLETIREYAGDRLNDSTEGKAVRARHLAFYLALAEDAQLGVIGAQQREWLQQLDLERENLLLAHRSCDEVPDSASMGLRLVFAIRMYWGSRGLLELGKRVTLEALARTGARVRNVERCRALFAAGQIQCFMGQYAEGRTHLEESLGIADEVGDEAQRASITTTLALAALGEGDHSAAEMYFEKAIELSREEGNKRELAASVNGLAQLKRMQGALDVADQLYLQALALMHEFGDWQNSAFIQLNLAIVAIGRKSRMSARETLQSVLAISVEMQSKQIGQCALDVCAALAALCGEWKRAARFFGVVDAQMGETGYQRDPADEAFVAPVITRARKMLDAGTFDRANSQGRALLYDDAINEARVWLTSLADRGHAAGETPAAIVSDVQFQITWTDIGGELFSSTKLGQSETSLDIASLSRTHSLEVNVIPSTLTAGAVLRIDSLRDLDISPTRYLRVTWLHALPTADAILQCRVALRILDGFDRGNVSVLAHVYFCDMLKTFVVTKPDGTFDCPNLHDAQMVQYERGYHRAFVDLQPLDGVEQQFSLTIAEHEFGPEVIEDVSFLIESTSATTLPSPTAARLLRDCLAMLRVKPKEQESGYAKA